MKTIPDTMTEEALEPVSGSDVTAEPQSPQDPMPAFCDQIARYVHACKQHSETSQYRAEMVTRVKEYRKQHDGTYRLDYKTRLKDIYLALMSAHIETLISNMSVGLANVLQMSDKVVSVRPDDKTKYDRIREQWTNFVEALQVLQQLTNQPVKDAEGEYGEIVKRVDARLAREASMQELRMSKIVRESAIARWVPEGLWRAMVDGTAILTLDWIDGKPNVRIIDILNYYPSSSHNETLEQQTWRIEEDTITWFDVQEFKTLNEQTPEIGYRNLNKIGRLDPSMANASIERQENTSETAFGQDMPRWNMVGRLDFEGMFGDKWEETLGKVASYYGFMAPENPHTQFWTIEVINSDVPARFRPMPQFVNKIPDVRFVYKKAAETCFWGHGVYDGGGSSEEKLANLAEQLLALLMWSQVDPQIYGTSSAMSGRRNKLHGKEGMLPFSPGRFVDMGSGSKVQDLFAADRPPADALQNGIIYTDRMTGKGEKSTGATAEMQGAGNPGTATEATINLKQGTTRLSIKAWGVDQYMITPVIRMLFDISMAYESDTSYLDLDESGNVVPVDPKPHEFVIRIAEEAATSAVNAQLMMNLFGILGDKADIPFVVSYLAKNMQIGMANQLIDRKAMELADLTKELSIVQTKQALLLANQQLNQTETMIEQGIEPNYPGQMVDDQGNPMAMAGVPAGGPPQQTGGKPEASRMRTRSTPTNEMNVGNSVAKATKGNMNPVRQK